MSKSIYRYEYLVLLLVHQIWAEQFKVLDVEEGQCVPMHACPQIVDAFANPPKGSEMYLRQFVCKDGQELDVCCSHSNFTILEEQDSTQGHIDIFTKVQARHAFPRCSIGVGFLTDFILPVILAKNVGCDVEFPKCFGALINSRYVTTAAQCVVRKNQTLKFTVSSVRFVLKKDVHYVVGVEEEVIHPFYNPIIGLNDLALLRLNKTVSEDKVNPMCMHRTWSKALDEEPGAALLTYASLNESATEKWYENGGVSMSLYSPEACEEIISNKAENNTVLNKYYVCTEDFSEFCNEYLGVPLLLLRYPPLLIGISSAKTKCTDGLPDAYTNVLAYKEWLINSMRPWPVNNEQCRTPDGEAGRCMPLDYCPILLEAFLAATNDTEEYLRSFICKDVYDNISVCCATSSTSTSENKNEKASIKVPTEFLESKLCGMQHRDDYISSDTTVAIDEFPWIALIQVKEEGRYRGRCTGTLINARYVLTAVLCTYGLTNEEGIVRLGAYSWSNETDCVVENEELAWKDCSEIEIFGIEEVVLNPFGKQGSHFVQLALLRLNRTVGYTDFIRPICLPVKKTPIAKADDYLYLSSWGYKEYGFGEAIKKKVLTKIIEINECQRSYRKSLLSEPVNEFDICSLDDTDNTDFTNALDDGGALMMDNNYRWHLEGVISTPVIGYEVPKVYVNVSRHVNWVLANMHPWWEDCETKTFGRLQTYLYL